MSVITLKPGDSLTVIAEAPPQIWGGGNQPFPTPPIAGPGRPPWWGMAQDPGYSPPWARPGTGPVDPGYGVDAGLTPTHPIVLPPTVPPTPEHPWVPPSGPVDPGYFPPGVVAPPEAPDGGGNWVWAWLPGVGWRWVRVPGHGEAGPK